MTENQTVKTGYREYDNMADVTISGKRLNTVIMHKPTAE
jgi:hypothetical protein